MKIFENISVRFVFFLALLMSLAGCNPPNPATQATYTPIVLIDPDNRVVGVWHDTWAVEHDTTIRKINGIYQITYRYSDSSGSTQTPVVKVSEGEERLYYDEFGDWMVIQPDGRLSVYDKEGLIYEMKPKNK